MKLEKEHHSSKKPSHKTSSISKLRLIGTILWWLLLWPVYIGAIAFILVMLLAGAFGLISSGGELESYGYRAGVLFFTGVMVLICLWLIRSKNKENRPESRIATTILKVYIVLGVVLGAGIASVIPDTATEIADAGIQTETVSGVQMPSLQHDPKLVTILNQIGATDIDLIDKQYVDGYDDPAFPEKWGEYTAYRDMTTGQFLYGKLTIRRGLDVEQEKVSVAHEYLHHVWFKLLDSQTKENLTAHLIGMYGNDPALRHRVQAYVDSGKLYPTELFSFYCTESSNGYLTEYVIQECSKYVNRSALSLSR